MKAGHYNLTIKLFVDTNRKQIRTNPSLSFVPHDFGVVVVMLTGGGSGGGMGAVAHDTSCKQTATSTITRAAFIVTGCEDL